MFFSTIASEKSLLCPIWRGRADSEKIYSGWKKLRGAWRFIFSGYYLYAKWMIPRKVYGPSTAQFFSTRVHLQCFGAVFFLTFLEIRKNLRAPTGTKKFRTRSVTTFFKLLGSSYVHLELSDVSFGSLSKKLDFI